MAFVPVHYLDQTVPFDRMCALYRVADVMLITSIRDGMNLVAYEYIACQTGHNGVLILSEFTGAAQSLGAGALQVNPWNISEVADALSKALTMSETERQERTSYCKNHVMVHTAKAWARKCVQMLETYPVQEELNERQSSRASTSSASSLGSSVEHSKQMQASIPLPLDVNAFLSSFVQSKNRLVITGLAGIVNRAAVLGDAIKTGSSADELPDQMNTEYKELAGELWGWQEEVPRNNSVGAFNQDASKRTSGVACPRLLP